MHSVFVVLTSVEYGDCSQILSVHLTKEGAETEKERLFKKDEEDGGELVFWTETHKVSP